MKLVITIDDDIYDDYLKQGATLPKYGTAIDSLYEALWNGVPLPKRHGRLIDADALEKKMCDREEELGDDRALWESSAVSVALDMFAPTIIEAEEEG